MIEMQFRARRRKARYRAVFVFLGCSRCEKRVRELRSALVVPSENEGNYSGCRLRRGAGNRIAIDKPFHAYFPPRERGNARTPRYKIIANVVIGFTHRSRRDSFYLSA